MPLYPPDRVSENAVLKLLKFTRKRKIDKLLSTALEYLQPPPYCVTRFRRGESGKVIVSVMILRGLWWIDKVKKGSGWVCNMVCYDTAFNGVHPSSRTMKDIGN